MCRKSQSSWDMDKTIRSFTSLEAMKAEEYSDWQERPAHERMSAVSEMTLATYALKEPAPDVRRLQRTLVHLPRPGVKHWIVGGYAVSFHTQPRATKDIDLLIKPDAQNAKAVYAALAGYGAPLEGLTAEDFSDRCVEWSFLSHTRT
jgi:hypothetical protein